MNTFKHIFFALFVLFFTISGCKKDSDKPDNMPANNGIEFKNGYLVFRDTTTFIQHMEWIKQHETNPEVIYEFNKKLGFISFSEVYDEGMRISDPSEFEKFRLKNPDCFKKIILEDNSVFWEMPMGSLMSLLSNNLGVYQIGETLFRLTEDFSFSTMNEEKYSIIIQNEKALADPNIASVKNNENNTYKDLYSYKTDYFQWSDRRIVARLYAIRNGSWPYTYYNEARVTSQQNRGILGWQQADIDEVQLSWDAGYYRVIYPGGQLSSPIAIPSKNYFAFNASDIRKTVVESRYYQPQYNYSTCLADHRGKRYGNVAEVSDNEIFPDIQ